VTAYNVLLGNEHVRVSQWFTLQDFAPDGWGLIDEAGNLKPSWNAFVQIANNNDKKR